jgi:Short C-terminal domain
VLGAVGLGLLFGKQREPSPQALDQQSEEPADASIEVAEAAAPSAELERLADLHARGILTDDEFQQAKQRVLGEWERPQGPPVYSRTGGRIAAFSPGVAPKAGDSFG